MSISRDKYGRKIVSATEAKGKGKEHRDWRDVAAERIGRVDTIVDSLLADEWLDGDMLCRAKEALAILAIDLSAQVPAHYKPAQDPSDGKRTPASKVPAKGSTVTFKSTSKVAMAAYADAINATSEIVSKRHFKVANVIRSLSSARVDVALHDLTTDLPVSDICPASSVEVLAAN